MVSLEQQVRALWQRPGQDPAVWFEGEWWNNSTIVGLADEVLAFIGDAGAEEAKLVIALENHPAVVAAVLAGIAGGRDLHFVNAMQPVERLERDLRQLSPRVLLATEGTWERLGPAGPELATCGGVLNGADRHLRPLFGKAEKPGDGQQFEATFLELFTSGTTGPAKRVRLTMAQINASMGSVLAHNSVRAPGKGSKSPSVIAIPIAHIGGLFGMLQALAEPRPLILLPRFRVEAWVAAVREHRPRFTGLPPAALRMVYDANVPREDLESLRAINAGTAPLDPALVDDFLDRYGIPILNVYGATEFAGAIAGWSLPLFREWWDRKRGSVGRPQPGVQIQVVDDSGSEVERGALGLLRLRSAQTTAGPDGWVATTDRATHDEDDFLWITGRADGMIIRGGFKVDPTVVADVLERHESVTEAAVRGLADRRLGEVPVAVVEVRQGVVPPTEAELEALCRQSLTSYEVPVAIKVVEKLPRTPSMKVSGEGVLALFPDLVDEPDAAIRTTA